MSVAGNYDDMIPRRWFAWIRRSDQRKSVRSEDRQQDRRYHQGIVRFHAKNMTACSVGFHSASVGFSTTPEAGISPPSCEVMERIALVALGGKDRLRIGARNFADCDPAESADQRAEQK